MLFWDVTKHWLVAAHPLETGLIGCPEMLVTTAPHCCPGNWTSYMLIFFKCMPNISIWYKSAEVKVWRWVRALGHQGEDKLIRERQWINIFIIQGYVLCLWWLNNSTLILVLTIYSNQTCAKLNLLQTFGNLTTA